MLRLSRMLIEMMPHQDAPARSRAPTPARAPESSSGSSSSSSSDEEEHVVVILHFSRKFLVQTLQIQQDKDGQKEAKAETAKAFGKLKQFNCSIHLCICLSRSPDDTQSFLPFQGCCKPIEKAWAKDQGASTMLTNPFLYSFNLNYVNFF